MTHQVTPQPDPPEAGDVVGRWTRRRTFDGRAWSARELLQLKGSTTVSLVVPALDEAATVGGIVERLRRDLVDDVPLVDEIVVIDSDSADATAEVARAAGARVHAAREVLPELGWVRGKGEAMWKSLFVTRGDLVVFLDADLSVWGPHFVTGLLGPLLTEPEVLLVKAFYDRLGPGGEERDGAGGAPGGRVTELVARPLLAQSWPTLSGVVQPLSGEWAARRSLVEQLPWPTGYGVELGVLVDTADRHGLDAVAQVDLGRRGHRQQALLDLGAMALQLHAAADARRFPDRARPEHVDLRQFGWGPTRRVPRVRAVRVSERPPAASLPQYRQRAALA